MAKKNKYLQVNRVKKNSVAMKNNSITVKNVEEEANTQAEIVVQNKINFIPKVSVIIPVYNVEKYIGECLDSVINQTLKEIEIICVDDGSSDNSLEVLKTYAKKDKRIKIISRENKGVGYSRNQGIEIAQGTYIAFMDPDDYYPSVNVLQDLYNGAIKHKVNICGGSLILFDEVKGVEIKKTDCNNKFSKDAIMAYSDFQYDYGFQRYIFNTKFLKNNKIIFPNYKRFQDVPFLVNAMATAKEFYAMSLYTYGYRWSHKTVAWTEEKVYHLLLGLKDVLEICLKNQLDKLYSVTLVRLKNEYKKIIAEFESDRIKSAKQEIMDLCLSNVKNRYKNDKTKAKVSIVLPIYNAEPYLRECLDSCIHQTLEDIEIICVNDGSTDNSLSIVKEYAKKDKRIKYIDKPNAGYGQTMNCGMALANGEYIGIVEPDDFIKLDMYETLYKKAKELDLDIIKSDYYQFEEKNGKYEYKQMPVFGDKTYYDRLLSPEKDIKMLYAFSINPAGIFRTSFLNKYDIKHNETPGAAYQDNGFWVQTMYLAKRIYFMDKPFYCYRQDNPNQSMKKKNNVWTIPVEYEFIDKVFDKHKELNILKPIYVYRKYLAYIYHMCLRLDEIYWSEYLDRMSKEFKQHQNNNEINKKYYSQKSFADLNLIINDYQTYIEQNSKRAKVVISLTSYPARIDKVDETIKTLINQSMKADKIILWLATDEFPNKEKDLPEQLLLLKEQGLTIDWCENIKSYKKLIPTLKKYPDSIIVTADDDLIYPENWLQLLYESYLLYPNDINCHRSHQIKFSNNLLMPYRSWNMCIKNVEPSFSNFCTSGGGILYPPQCLYKDILNKKLFMSLCPSADDIWFWAMCILNNKKIRVVNNNITTFKVIEETQDNALWKLNILENKNDEYLRKILKAYPNIMEKLLNDTHQVIQEEKYSGNKLKAYLLFPLYLYKLSKAKKKLHKLTCKNIWQQLMKNNINVFRLDKGRLAGLILKYNPQSEYVKKNLKYITNAVYDKCKCRKKHRFLGIKFYTHNKHKELMSIMQYTLSKVNHLEGKVDTVIKNSIQINEIDKKLNNFAGLISEVENIKTACMSTHQIITATNQSVKDLKESSEVIQQVATATNQTITNLNNCEQKHFQELNYADLLHDTICESSWLKNKTLSLFGWAANYSFIYLLYRLLDKVNPQNILEMGLGQTTKLTSQYVAYKNLSAHLNICEHNQDWINIYQPELPQSENMTINHFDLEFFEYNGKRNDKYKGMSQKFESEKFDLIIVDGPVGGGKNLPRSNILELIENNNLADDFVIVFDDAERQGEKTTIALTKDLLKQKGVEFTEFDRIGIKRQYIITSQSRSFVQFL